MLDKLKKRFSVTQAIIVCDRARASSKNVAALREAGFFFVVASKLRQLPEHLRINDRSLLTQLHEKDPEEETVLFRAIDHPKYPDSTLIITYSPKRAAKDRQDRERLLEKIRDKLNSEASSIKQLISNAAYKKFTTVKKGSALTFNPHALEEDIAWDAFHGITVSKGANLSVQEALSRYADLWRVEPEFDT